MQNYFTTKKGESANENNEVDDNIEEIIDTDTESEHQPESKKGIVYTCCDVENKQAPSSTDLHQRHQQK